MELVAIGQIEIEEGLVLNNPTLNILNVNYSWVRHSVDVIILFNEEGSVFSHSRTYTFNTDDSGELTTLDIIGFINSHSILKVFK